MPSPNLPQGQYTLRPHQRKMFREAGISPSALGYNAPTEKFTPGPVATVYRQDEYGNITEKTEGMSRAQWRAACLDTSVICVRGINCRRDFGAIPEGFEKQTINNEASAQVLEAAMRAADLNTGEE